MLVYFSNNLMVFLNNLSYNWIRNIDFPTKIQTRPSSQILQRILVLMVYLINILH